MLYGRSVEELNSIDDCVEEIIASYSMAMAMAAFGDRPGIYERLTEIILRAREVPPPVVDPDSQLPKLFEPPVRPV